MRRAEEYRVQEHVAKLGGRHRSSVVELSIRNPARPAPASAGRCVFKELGEASDDERSPETPSLAPPLAPRLQSGMTVLTATLTCPHCEHEKSETMPTNACAHFYQCTGCGTILRPKPGDCCVFCSYGSSRCPPRQTEGS